MMKINARHLVLDLLLARMGESLDARDAIQAASLFGISDNATRVAIARLAGETLIRASGRGRYELGEQGAELAGDVAAWRQVERRLRPWQGGYIAVAIGHLGRTDRSALARRERALGLLGFGELDKGLHVRPDNIEASPAAVRERLLRLGLDADARVLTVSAWCHPGEDGVRRLWDGDRLNARYRELTAQLEASLEASRALEPADAAREFFVLGRQAIRELVYDPLLPDAFIDAAARQTFIDSVRHYDLRGHEAWQRYFAELR